MRVKYTILTPAEGLVKNNGVEITIPSCQFK